MHNKKAILLVLLLSDLLLLHSNPWDWNFWPPHLCQDHPLILLFCTWYTIKKNWCSCYYAGSSPLLLPKKQLRTSSCLWLSKLDMALHKAYCQQWNTRTLSHPPWACNISMTPRFPPRPFFLSKLVPTSQFLLKILSLPRLIYQSLTYI